MEQLLERIQKARFVVFGASNSDHGDMQRWSMCDPYFLGISHTDKNTWYILYRQKLLTLPMGQRKQLKALSFYMNSSDRLDWNDPLFVPALQFMTENRKYPVVIMDVSTIQHVKDYSHARMIMMSIVSPDGTVYLPIRRRETLSSSPIRCPCPCGDTAARRGFGTVDVEDPTFATTATTIADHATDCPRLSDPARLPKTTTKTTRCPFAYNLFS